MRLRHNRLLLLFLAGSMTLSSVVPVSASTLEKTSINSKSKVYAERAVDAEDDDLDDDFDDEGEITELVSDGDEDDFYSYDDTDAAIESSDDAEDPEVEDEDDSDSSDDEESSEEQDDQEEDEQKNKKDKDDREEESETEEVSDNEAPSEDVSSNEAEKEEVEEAEETDAENVGVSENKAFDAEAEMSILSVSDNIAAHSVSVCAISGMENKPSQLADGTLGLVKGMKWYVGRDAGAEAAASKNIKANAKKGYFQVKKPGTAVAGVNGKSYNVTIVDPVMSEKKLKLNVGGSASVSVNNKVDGASLTEMGYKIAWVSSNPNVAQVVDGQVYATGLGSARIFAYIGGKAFKTSVRVSDTKASTYLMDIPKGRTKPIKVPKANQITWSFEGDKINIKDMTNKVHAIDQGLTDVYGNDAHGVRVYNNEPDIDTSYGIASVGKAGKNCHKYTVKMIAGDKLFINFDKSHELTTWRSKDPSVAQVSEYGVIIAEGKGTTVLSTRQAGKKVQITVVVGDERSYDYDKMSNAFYQKVIVDGINGNQTIYAFIRLNGDTVIGTENPDSFVMVNFDANGGKPSMSQRIGKGSRIESYEPTKEGDTFLGWLQGKYLFDFSTAVNTDLGLKADWANDKNEKFLLLLDANGGKLPGLADGSLLGMSYVSEGTVDLSDSIPVRDGYTFAGWFYQDGKQYDESDVLTHDTTLIAHWTDNSTGETVGQTDVYVLFNDTHGYISIERLNSNRTVDAPEVTWDGHIFNHWMYSDGKKYEETDTFTRTTILTAKWDITDTNEAVAVRFKPNNGDDAYSVNVNYGETVSAPEDPVNGTLGFKGWYLGDTFYDFDEPVTRPITLTAHYDEAYAIYFNTGVSDCEIPTQHIVSGNKAKKPKTSYFYGKYPNHTLAGWHNEAVNDMFNFNVPIEADVSLNAVWEDAEAHLIPGKKFNEKAIEVCGGAAALDDIERFAFYEKGVPDSSVLTDDHKVSDARSNTPIYIWKDGDTLYWWSEDTDPYMNENSANMFEGFSHLSDLSGLTKIRTDYVTNYLNMFKNTAVTNISFNLIGWEDLLRRWELGFTDGDYRTLSFNFVDNNALGKKADKSYIAYSIHVKNPSGGTSVKTGFIRSGDTLKVLRNTEVRLTAPQFKDYQYNHYFDNWTGAGKAFDEESGQRNLSEFTGSSFTFEMNGDAVISLETVPMPAFFG